MTTPDPRTVGQRTRRDALARVTNHPDYDALRPLQDDESRCPDCGFISRDGTHAQTAHDDLCDYVVED